MRENSGDNLRLTLGSDLSQTSSRRKDVPDGKIERLIDLIGNEQFSIRVAATKKLSLLGKKAVPGLLEALQKGLWFTRECAAQALGNIGDPRAIEPLIFGLRDENVGVRRSAARALATMIEKEGLSLVAKAIAQADQGARRDILEAVREASPLAARKLNEVLGGHLEPSSEREKEVREVVGEEAFSQDSGRPSEKGRAGWLLWKKLRRFLEAWRQTLFCG